MELDRRRGRGVYPDPVRTVSLPRRLGWSETRDRIRADDRVDADRRLDADPQPRFGEAQLVSRVSRLLRVDRAAQVPLGGGRATQAAGTTTVKRWA